VVIGLTGTSVCLITLTSRVFCFITQQRQRLLLSSNLFFLLHLPPPRKLRRGTYFSRGMKAPERFVNTADRWNTETVAPLHTMSLCACCGPAKRSYAIQHCELPNASSRAPCLLPNSVHMCLDGCYSSPLVLCRIRFLLKRYIFSLSHLFTLSKLKEERKATPLLSSFTHQDLYS
jgi:hypothetical protein